MRKHVLFLWLTGIMAPLAVAAERPNIVYIMPDELGYYAEKDVVHVNDLHAMMLHQLGIDHEQLTYRYQGRDFRLTDVGGRVIREFLT